MSYLCRHVLLKDASGETQGFVRFESAPDGCSVDVRASGLPSGARLLLLRRGGGFREAGALRAGAFRAVLRGEDYATPVKYWMPPGPAAKNSGNPKIAAITRSCL